MQVSTKGRFAVTAMTDLAMAVPGVPVSLESISTRRKISLSYLEQLAGKLRRQGLIRSVRGPRGGYVLARPPESISVADIVAAVDTSDPPRSDGPDGLSCDGGDCLDTSSLWTRVNTWITDYLGAISLQAVVEGQEGSGAPTAIAPANHGLSAGPVVKRLRTNAPNSVFAFGLGFNQSAATK